MKGRIIHSRQWAQDKNNLDKPEPPQGKSIEDVINKLFPNRVTIIPNKETK